MPSVLRIFHWIVIFITDTTASHLLLQRELLLKLLTSYVRIRRASLWPPLRSAAWRSWATPTSCAFTRWSRPPEGCIWWWSMAAVVTCSPESPPGGSWTSWRQSWSLHRSSLLLNTWWAFVSSLIISYYLARLSATCGMDCWATHYSLAELWEKILII